MGKSTFPTIAIADIEIPENRARQLDDAWVEVIAGMLEHTPLLHPVRLREVDGKFRLVAGNHRLAAYILLERTEIPYTLSQAESDEEARLEEVLENLGRNELKSLDRAQHLYEMKEAYEAIHPETKQGGDRKSEAAKDNQNVIIPFWSEAANHTGLSASAIQKAIKIWKSLSAATKREVRPTWIADHQATLLGLSKLSAHMQKKVLPYLVEKQAANVEEALVLSEHKKLPGALEKKFQSIDRSLRTLERPQLHSVFHNFEDEIVEWVREKGLV
jgi:ParB family chromosome partitioning protein